MTDIRTVTFKDGKHWIVQGLEHDICAAGETIEEANRRFDIAVHYEAQEPGGLERLPQAPQKFWDMLAEQEARG